MGSAGLRKFSLAQSEFGVAAAMGLDVIDASCGHDPPSPVGALGY
jgi:hypothetical protein